MTEKLTTLRTRIESLDTAMFLLLGERFKITREVGLYKKECDLPALDQQRQDEIINKYRNLAADIGLDPALIETLITTIMKKVVQEHNSLNDK